MYHRRKLQPFDGVAEEGGFFADAFHQVDLGPLPLRQRASDDDAGEAAAGTEIDPAFGLRRERQELKRVGDVPGPDVGQRRARDQVEMRRDPQQVVNEHIQPGRCFT